MNYTVTKKEFLAVVFTAEKFRSYFIGSHVIIFTDHVVVKQHRSKRDAKITVVGGVLLLRQFEYQIIDTNALKTLLLITV